MIRTIFLLLGLLLLLLGPQYAGAQQQSAPAKQDPSDVQSLRKKLEEQEAQINQLKETSQRQAALIEKQQRLLETLQEKVDQANKPVFASAVLETAAAKAQASPTPPNTDPKPATKP